MTIYAIGDVQGCFDELQELLTLIHFNKNQDTLWFTGDLVNRGPQSLETLRFVKELGEEHITVLGNHDLHLLAVYVGAANLRQDDTIQPILEAHDVKSLMQWLRTRPLLHHDKQNDFVMVHAGLAPNWTLKQAKVLAHEVELILQSDASLEFFKNMYGNKPDLWNDDLQGLDRWRCIINYLTRMRFCHPDGRLDLSYKGEIQGKPENLLPWFDVPDRANANEKIIFGHWAALGGKTSLENIFALDTGCVWGNRLTAMRLEDGERFSVKCGNG